MSPVQTWVIDPTNTYPSSQLYIATEPRLLPDVNVTCPFGGGGSVTQVDATALLNDK